MVTESIEHSRSSPSPGRAEEVIWVTSPARKQPVLAVIASLVLLGLGFLIALIAGDWIWGALALVFLFATLSRFYLPSRVAINAEGIRAEFPLRTRRVTWHQIKWIRHDDRGALIRLQARSLLRSSEFTILFGDRPQEAIEALERFAPEAALAPATGKDPS
jgi:hypothetical protein